MWCTKPLRSKVDQDQTQLTHTFGFAGKTLSDPPAVAGGCGTD